jgi:hypothetical protein
MGRRAVAVAGLLALLAAARPAAACSICRCGDPPSMVAGAQLFTPGRFHFGLDLERYAKDQVSTEDPALRESETESRLVLSGMYSMGSRLTAMLRLPVAMHRLSEGPDHSTLTGLADPELLLGLRLLGTTGTDWLALSAGVRTGWGQNDRQIDGARADEHLQPGTGAAAALLGLSGSKGFAHRGALIAAVQGRLESRNDAGHRYGDAVVGSVAAQWPFTPRLFGVMQVDAREAGQDEVAPGVPDPNTGGTVVYLSPRLLFQLQRLVFLRFGVQVPVVERLHGDQDEKVNVLAGLTVRF